MSGKENPIVLARHGSVIPHPRSALPIYSREALNSLPKFRIGSISAKSKYDDYYLIEDFISFDNIFDFFELAGRNKSCQYLILDPCAISILSQVHITPPKNIKTLFKFTGVSVNSISEAIQLINAMIDRYSDDFLLAKSFNAWESARLHKIVERSLRSKNDLDSWFYHIPNGTANIHLKAMESRPDRAVLGFDFNSMFASTLNESNYPRPADLVYVKSKEARSLYRQCVDGLISGAFICTVSNLSKVMQDCMMTAQVFAHFSVKVKMDKPTTMVMHANEIALWHEHADIDIIEGVCSKTMIQHPLHKLAKSTYEFRAGGNIVERKLAKQELLLMHACTSRRYPKTISNEDAISFFGFREKDIQLDDMIVATNLEAKANIYCLQRQVLANARVKLWKTILLIKKEVPDAELCYGNVDSLHYSVPVEQKESLIEALPIGSGLGELKVEFDGTQGLWLDPGRWWIKNAGKIIEFRSGSERLTPDFMKMSLQCSYVQESLNHYSIEKINPQEDAIEMSRLLSVECKKTFSLARKLWGEFIGDKIKSCEITKIVEVSNVGR